MTMLYGFLLGVIATSSLAAGLFFLKFWRHTRDSLFLVFAIAFIVEGLNRTTFIFLAKPNEGVPLIYIIRLAVFLLILAAVLKKNYGTA
jgi:uncharacterized membrane protein HdeD (DUF308 family)